MKKIIPYNIIESTSMKYSNTQDRSEMALELAKIYFKENFKRYVHALESDSSFRPLDTFRNIILSKDYALSTGKEVSLFVNKTEPKNNKISDTKINIFVNMTNMEYLSELYRVYTKSNKPDTDSFIDATFKFTYTRTRVIINNIVGRFIRAISTLENKDNNSGDLNTIRIFDMAFDKRTVITPKGEMYSIDTSYDKFLKRIKLNGVKFETLDDEAKEELIVMFEEAYNDYIENHYNTPNLIKKIYRKEYDHASNEDNIISTFGEKFFNKHKAEIEDAANEPETETENVEVNIESTEIPFSNLSTEEPEVETDVIAKKVFFGGKEKTMLTFKKGKMPLINSKGSVSGNTVNVNNNTTPNQGVAKRRR